MIVYKTIAKTFFLIFVEVLYASIFLKRLVIVNFIFLCKLYVINIEIYIYIYIYIYICMYIYDTGIRDILYI